ncbi:hypothetical protein NVV43_29195, partial [Escherichia marmotae]|nr:hypothetical protein [Escherichia marmotae]
MSSRLGNSHTNLIMQGKKFFRYFFSLCLVKLRTTENASSLAIQTIFCYFSEVRVIYLPVNSLSGFSSSQGI